MSTRASGIAIALTTALISGVAIYVNGYAVKHVSDPSVFTTAKNAVAGVLLTAAAVALRRRADAREERRPARRTRFAASLAVLAVVGGSVPFVLFFEGLARSHATQAAFIQKTLVVWVALLAVPFLRERIGVPHALAIVLLVLGQAWMVGSLGTVVFGRGEAMIFAATLLWAIEVVYVKRLLEWIGADTLAAARMALGTLVLLGWLGVTGKVGKLAALDAAQWKWVLLSGLLLTGYVATWYAALARAQAVDVTAVLVVGAVVTAVLSGAANGTSISVGGTVLIAAGVALVSWAALREHGGRQQPA